MQNLGETKLGFNFFQINLLNQELRVFQIIGWFYPADSRKLECLIPKAHFFTLDIKAELAEHIHYRY